MAKYTGIDVSKWQGTIDWSKVKNAGINFAIIRAGYGKESSQVDKYFHTNMKNAQANKIPCGVYWYSYATTIDQAKQEARVCLDTIKGYKLEYPVVFDIEDKSQLKLTNRQRTDIVKAFCSEIEKASYYAMVYCNLNWWNNYLIKDELKKYDLWLAQWNVEAPSVECGIWQKSEEGIIAGIDGKVDLNIAYKDYPLIMKTKGLNGYSKVSANNYSQVIEYTVKKGDTLWKIAEKYLGNGKKYLEIKDLNKLQSDNIYPGQKLLIKK